MDDQKGRPKKYNIPYTGNTVQMEAAAQKYLACVVDFFGEPYDDREERSEDEPSLRDVCDEFKISIPKARKLLITAGVYSTELSRQIAELLGKGKSVAEVMALTGLSRSSVSSYLPYKRFFYNMDKISDSASISRHDEDSRKYRERRKAVEELHRGIMEKNADTMSQSLDRLLWQAVIAYQNYLFHTASGLPFFYTVNRKKNREYSGEMVISRKEESKTLTRSSVMLAFRKVLGKIKTKDIIQPDNTAYTVIVPSEYKGPKAIGQIFGISYIYSLFWKLGLITVPGEVEERLNGKKISDL